MAINANGLGNLEMAVVVTVRIMAWLFRGSAEKTYLGSKVTVT
jgi:hypothetical protein